MKEKIEQLKRPFDTNDIEWRVQQAGKSSDGKIWCMVLAYVDARALQNRLDEVFTPFGWEDSYEPIGDDFICTLTVEVDNKKVSKQNGASKTQVEGFKGGISNAFKRVCASGYGIGRYLYDLDTMFAETTTDKQSGSEWVRSSFKDKESNKFINYWFKKPQLPDFAVPRITKEKVDELLQLMEQKGSTRDSIEAYLLDSYNITKIEDMTNPYYNVIFGMLTKKKNVKAEK
jgi:hypothetical protein